MSSDLTNFLVIEYLRGIAGAEEAAAILSRVTGVSYNEDSFKQFSLSPNELPEIINSGINSLDIKPYSKNLELARNNPKFESFLDVVVKKGYFEGTEEDSVEYLKRKAKLIQKFKEKAASLGPTPEEIQQQAEELKVKGNALINAKDYDGAIKYYTEAIELSKDGPNSHVYYSNRAAAYCYVNKHQEAIDDCHKCIELSPDYSKAYSRLGLANFFLKRYEEAVEAYERAVELEPDNKGNRDSLQQARNKLKKNKNAVASTPSNSADAMPDLSALAGLMGGGGGGGVPPGLGGMMNNPAMKQAMDKVGGTAGLANLMKDPQMMAMAQQMMKDPAMMQQAMSMLGGGGGAGGLPDLGALSGMLGGAGDTASSGAPSSSSKGGKKPFKGFEE
eukprot:gene7443-10141_t